MKNVYNIYTYFSKIYLNKLPIISISGDILKEWKLVKLLHINETSLEGLPPEIGELSQLTMVSLNNNNNNKLKSLPKEISFLG